VEGRGRLPPNAAESFFDSFEAQNVKDADELVQSIRSVMDAPRHPASDSLLCDVTQRDGCCLHRVWRWSP
jgi:hypothetical protein